MNFLENIFSVKKEQNRKILRILGIKIKLGKKNKIKNEEILYKNDILQMINTYLQTKGSTVEIKYILNFLEASTTIDNKVNVFSNYIYLLIYASLLTETDENSEIKRILDKYLRLKQDVNNIARFLPLSYWVKNNMSEILTEKIEKSAKIFEALDKAHKENSFINYIKDKTIAIVGNGPQEVGKNKAEEIDSHDIVIRFNMFKTGEYEKDYGKKTSVWVVNNEAVSGRVVPPAKPDFILYKGDINYTRILGNAVVNECPIDTDCKVDYMGLEQNKIAQKYFPNQNAPTLGFLVALWIYDTFKTFENIDFYGFSFLEDEYKGCLHYFENTDDNQANIQRTHHHLEESIILKKLVQGKEYNQDIK